VTLEHRVADLLPSVEAQLNYLVPMSERPRNYAMEPPPGVPRSNTKHEAHTVAIRDARPIFGRVSLDGEGFGFLEHRSAVLSFANEDEIRAVYYPEAEALVKEATGADRVFIFDHTLRRRVPGAEDRRDVGPRQPALRVHIDHTAKSGPQRVRDFFPDEAEELLKGRVQVINLWRPIHHPVYDAPLAVCDARSVAAADLVPSDLVYEHRVGETYSITYNPAHRWFYLSEMRPDEAMLIKCCDSATDRARFTPHSAFINPAAAPDAPPRESIEIRTLVFHYA
jgi:hypothetical protein